MANDYVSAAEAAEFLQVKRQTLYAYVSRGWLESIPDPNSHRAKLYKRADLERLKARAGARAGDAPVAASALRWGAPVLETEICEIDESGPRYRGRAVREFVEEPTSFEDVVRLLVGLDVPPADVPADLSKIEGRHDPIDIVRAAVLRAEFADSTRFVMTDEASANHVGRMFGMVLAHLGAARGQQWPDRASIAVRTTHGLGGNGADERAVRAVETALVVSAEHELNVSAFAARVAASSGANLYACVTAALAAFIGPRHGGVGWRVRRLLAECENRRAVDVLSERLRAGETIPGLGHPLYPGGDPRFRLLWDAALAFDREGLRPAVELVAAIDELGLEPPNLDLGLVAVATACDLVPGSEAALFAIGRMAGWLAHAREQAEQGFLLRPRAAYVGR